MMRKQTIRERWLWYWWNGGKSQTVFVVYAAGFFGFMAGFFTLVYFDT